MAKKRKSDATRLDEVDRSMYTTFCSAANSLSQLYSQAMNHQRLSFQAGERHALVWFSSSFLIICIFIFRFDLMGLLCYRLLFVLSLCFFSFFGGIVSRIVGLPWKLKENNQVWNFFFFFLVLSVCSYFCFCWVLNNEETEIILFFSNCPSCSQRPTGAIWCFRYWVVFIFGPIYSFHGEIIIFWPLEPNSVNFLIVCGVDFFIFFSSS